MAILFGGQWSGPEKDPGFGLINSDVTKFNASGSLIDVPVTVNHNGLTAAVSRLDSAGVRLTKESFRSELNKATGVDRIVGRVVSAGPGTSVVFSLSNSFPGLQEMVRSGIFTGKGLLYDVFSAKIGR